MAHIFISYSKKDIVFARHLRGLLQAQGFDVWMDETRLVPSKKWWPTIEENIHSSDAFVVIMSPESRESDWVEREILVAEKYKKSIFPVLLAGESWSRLAEIQYEDMRATDATLSQDLINALVAVINPSSTPKPSPLPGPLLPQQARPTMPNTPSLPSRRGLREILSSPTWAGIGGIVGIIALLVTIYFAMNSSSPPTTTATHTPQAVVVDPSETPAPPTETPTNTAVPPTETAIATPTNTLTPTTVPPLNTPEAPTPIAAVGDTITLTIFREKDSLMLYVPEMDQPLSLAGFKFQVVTTRGDDLILQLDKFPSFLGLPFGNLGSLAPLCLRLMRDSNTIPAPLVCQGITLVTQRLAQADVFWYDDVNKTERLVTVLRESTTLGVCAPGTATCQINLAGDSQIATTVTP